MNDETAKPFTPTPFAFINVTSVDGTLIERIECSAKEYEMEMRRPLPIPTCRRNAVPTGEIADALMRAYKQHDEARS